MTGISAVAWETGSWADIAGLLGGPLRIAVVVGGNDPAVWMFKSIGESYSGLPRLAQMVCCRSFL